MRPAVVILFFLGILSDDAIAQDTHYWNNQYGSRAELVGGLVVGGVLDLSTTYYNPGALGFVTEPTLILNNDAWEYMWWNFDEVIPQGFDVSSRRLRHSPSMFAIQVPLKESHHRIAFSFLNRYSFKLSADGRSFLTRSQIDSAGVVPSAREVTARFVLNEAWLGASWAYPVGSHIGVGATTYFAGRSQQSRDQVFYQRIGEDDGATEHRVSEYGYWNARVLWKLGISFNYDPLRFGITVTTPSIDFLGGGKVIFNQSSLTRLPPGVSDGQIAASEQTDLPATYMSPAAIATGVSYRLGTTRIYATAEYFDSISEYKVLDPRSFRSQVSGDTLSIDLTNSVRAVLNWGVGIEHGFGSNYSAYAAFFTDRSTARGERPTRLSATTWNIYHVSAGGALGLAGFDVTLGLSYGFGATTVENGVYLPDTNLDASYSSLKVVFGFTVPI